MQLTESIKKGQLLHPLVVRRDATGCHLVAGERRLRAIKDLWVLGGVLFHDGQAFAEGFVPVTNLGDLSPLAAEEAELEENVQRTDISWQERASAEARLHALRMKQAAAQGKDHTIAATAKELHGASTSGPQTTRQSIIVMGQMADPEVANAESLEAAFKVIKKKDERARNAALGIEVGKTFNIASHRILNMDCLTWLKGCEDSSFDVILTDPPYGMGADEFGDGGGAATSEHAYRDDEESFKELMKGVIPQLIRVAKPIAHAYVFCDLDRYHWLKAGFEAAGWKVHRTPLIWNKMKAQRVPWPECGPRRHWEMCLYAVKGGKRTTKIAPDVITTDIDVNLGMSAQKPVALFAELLSRSTKPGDRVLDPFCGTGTIFPAAHGLLVEAVGIELSQSTYGIALKRLQSLSAG